MDEKIKQALDALFDKQEASRKEVVQAQKTEQQEQAAALKKFVELRDAVILPAMEKIAAYLKRKGYPSEIISEDEGVGERYGQPTLLPWSIAMRLGPTVRASNTQSPSLVVIWDKAKRKVTLHYSTFTGTGGNGESASAGEANLSDVTEDFIQQKILMVIEKVVR